MVNYIIEKYFLCDDLIFQWENDRSVDELKQAQVYQILWNMGVLSTDQIAEQLGYDPVGLSNTICTATPVVLVKSVIDGCAYPTQNAPARSSGSPTDDQGDQGDTPIRDKPADDQGDQGDTPNPAEKRTQGDFVKKKSQRNPLVPIRRDRPELNRFRSRMKVLVSKAIDQVKAHVKEQLPHVLRQARNFVSPMLTKADDVDSILAQINLTGFAVLIDPTQQLLQSVFAQGVTAAQTQIGFQPGDMKTFGLTNQAAIDYAQTRSAYLVTSVTDTTRDILRGLVTQAMQDNWSTDELADQIEESAAFGSYRSEMIARTEIAQADIRGNMSLYENSGLVTEKIWVLANGGADKCCDDCEANADEGEIPFNEEFQSGDDAPTAHPNCRCDIIPVLGDEDE